MRITEEEANLKTLITELEAFQNLAAEQFRDRDALVFEIGKFDLSELQTAKDRKEQALRQYYTVESDLCTKENRKKDLSRRLDDTKDRINVAQEKLDRMEKIRRTIELLAVIRDAYRSIQPKP